MKIKHTEIRFDAKHGTITIRRHHSNGIIIGCRSESITGHYMAWDHKTYHNTAGLTSTLTPLIGIDYPAINDLLRRAIGEETTTQDEEQIVNAIKQLLDIKET